MEFFYGSSIQVSFSIENNVNGTLRVSSGGQNFFDGLSLKFSPCKPCGPAEIFKITCNHLVAYK